MSVESLFDVYNLNGWEDEFVGSGVYRIKVGCRGEVDEVVKMRYNIVTGKQIGRAHV